MYITTFLLIKPNCVRLHVCVWLDTDILLSLSPSLSLSLFLPFSLSLSHNILYNWRFLPTPPNVSFLHLPCTSIIISFPVTHLSLSLSLSPFFFFKTCPTYISLLFIQFHHPLFLMNIPIRVGNISLQFRLPFFFVNNFLFLVFYFWEGKKNFWNIPIRCPIMPYVTHQPVCTCADSLNQLFIPDLDALIVHLSPSHWPFRPFRSPSWWSVLSAFDHIIPTSLTFLVWISHFWTLCFLFLN